MAATYPNVDYIWILYTPCFKNATTIKMIFTNQHGAIVSRGTGTDMDSKRAEEKEKDWIQTVPGKGFVRTDKE